MAAEWEADKIGAELAKAARDGDADAVRRLLSQAHDRGSGGAYVLSRALRGGKRAPWTVLQSAAIGGSVDCVEAVLRARGADARVCTESVVLACRYGKPDVLRVLLEQPGYVEGVAAASIARADATDEFGDGVLAKDSPLMEACDARDHEAGAECVRQLLALPSLDAEAHVCASTASGLTAVRCAARSGNAAALQALLAVSSEPARDFARASRRCETAFRSALSARHARCVDALLAACPGECERELLTVASADGRRSSRFGLTLLEEVRIEAEVRGERSGALMRRLEYHARGAWRARIMVAMWSSPRLAAAAVVEERPEEGVHDAAGDGEDEEEEEEEEEDPFGFGGWGVVDDDERRRELAAFRALPPRALRRTIRMLVPWPHEPVDGLFMRR